ncbi:hypothetical protein [Streptomyces microflavus]|uniref:hypothetical protein n=1 Tax=Streptomyces microflavus TaxID=1919 RepID=UPI00340D7B0C
MNEIPVESVPSLLLRTVPESGKFIAEKYGMPAGQAVLAEDSWVDLYEVLTETLMEPLVLPQLRSSDPDGELLRRCFDFLEQVVDHSSEHVRGAVYFEVLEPLLNPGTLVEDSFPYMKERMRKGTLEMLDSYDIEVPGVTDRR